MSPIVGELAMQLRGAMAFGKINIDEAKDIASAFRVSSIPTFVVLRNGKEVKRLQGANAEGLRTAAMNAVFQQQNVNFRSALESEEKSLPKDRPCCANRAIVFDETKGIAARARACVGEANARFESIAKTHILSKSGDQVISAIALSSDQSHVLDACCKTLEKSNLWHSNDSVLDRHHARALSLICNWPDEYTSRGGCLDIMQAFSAHPRGTGLMFRCPLLIRTALAHASQVPTKREEAGAYCERLALKILVNIVAAGCKANASDDHVSGIALNIDTLLQVCSLHLGSENSNVAAALLYNIALFVTSERCDGEAALHREDGKFRRTLSSCLFAATWSLCCRTRKRNAVKKKAQNRAVMRTLQAVGCCARRIAETKHDAPFELPIEIQVLIRSATRSAIWLSNPSPATRRICDDLMMMSRELFSSQSPDPNPNVQREPLPNPW